MTDFGTNRLRQRNKVGTEITWGRGLFLTDAGETAEDSEARESNNNPNVAVAVGHCKKRTEIVLYFFKTCTRTIDAMTRSELKYCYNGILFCQDH